MMLISTNTSNCIIYDMFKFRAQIGSNYHDIMEETEHLICDTAHSK